MVEEKLYRNRWWISNHDMRPTADYHNRGSLMRKIVHIGLTVAAVVLLVIVIVRPQIVDSAVLLEKVHPGYCEHIMNENSLYVEENAPYLITYVKKAGLGSVSPEDVGFYLHSLKNQYPGIERTTLSFDDDTGIEIFFSGEENSRYGRIDVNGIVVDENPSVVDLSRPLIDQIYDLSRVERKDREDREIEDGGYIF